MLWTAFDLAQFVNRLRVVGDRAVAIDRDGHRTHAEEAEGHQAEGEDRRGETEFLRHQRHERSIL